jgi:hypothetical protein
MTKKGRKRVKKRTLRRRECTVLKKVTKKISATISRMKIRANTVKEQPPKELTRVTQTRKTNLTSRTLRGTPNTSNIQMASPKTPSQPNHTILRMPKAITRNRRGVRLSKMLIMWRIDCTNI